jgi:hypothetical protein
MLVTAWVNLPAPGTVTEVVNVISAVAILLWAFATVIWFDGVGVMIDPTTLTGTLLVTVVPLPNAPLPLDPQHLTVPPESNAQE